MSTVSMPAVPPQLVDGWNKVSTTVSEGFQQGVGAVNAQIPKLQERLPSLPDVSNLKFQELNLQEPLNKFGKDFGKNVSSSMQQFRERLGQVPADEITELPQEYRDLEARVDALSACHTKFLKIAKVYETETYDYPTQIQESLTELSTSIGVTVNNYAANTLKGTKIPAPQPLEAPVISHKTLHHAFFRAITSAAKDLTEANPSNDDKLAACLQLYATVCEKVAEARVTQDNTIRTGFLQPWQQTLNNSISLAVKARQAVRVSRLELDAAKQALKNASPTRQEQTRLEVENAEDDLVQKTEVAITLMKNVLDNPESIKNLNELVKAQLMFYAASAEALSSVQGDIEELAVAAEGEYRKSRDH